MKVSFAHNVYDRFKTLIETIGVERQYFPNCDEFIASNSFVNDLSFWSLSNIKHKYFTETPQHKIGCTNGMMLTCNMALQNDFDVLIFSHDDVRLRPDYMELVNSHINDVFTGKYDLIYRNPSWLGEDYAMMEIVYMNRKAVETLFSEITLLKDESEIPRYVYNDNKTNTHSNSISPEHWFYKRVAATDLNANVIKFGSTVKDDEEICRGMGFYHINNGTRGWKS